MGNEESHVQRKDTAQPMNRRENPPSKYPTQQMPNPQSPMAPFNTANNNQPQSQQPGWIMPTPNIQGTISNMASQNHIYPNLPSAYNTAPHTNYVQPQIPQHPTAPNMFYPQAPTAPSQFNPQHSQHQPPPRYVPPPNMSHPIAPYNINDIWSKGNIIPSNAFRAGQDTDGTVIHICRAVHEGDLLPGKLVRTHTSAYICHGGLEIPKQNFEVLTGDQYRWVPSHNGQIPAGAVEGGRTNKGEKLYIGRASHMGSMTPGKLHPSHGMLYIPYGGKEIGFKGYEVLVHLNHGQR